MISTLQHIRFKYFTSKALVLMYHRVAEPKADVWDIAVSPSNFEQHLQVLRQTGRVIPLDKMVDSIGKSKVKDYAIAITFDDGYQDNYEHAKPLLEKYSLPATFFVSTAHTNKDQAYWWDELASIILETPSLPAILHTTIQEQNISFNLGKEAQLQTEQIKLNSCWSAATTQPPSLRCGLYLLLWQLLKPLPYQEQQKQLNKIKAWAGWVKESLPEARCMTSAQIRDLAQHDLFTIGAHTVTHPELANHTLDEQRKELIENKVFLEKTTEQSIALLSYPYGSYNHDTIASAREAGFVAAFTTEEKAVTKRTSPFQIGRCQVKNIAPTDFERMLDKWNN